MRKLVCCRPHYRKRSIEIGVCDRPDHYWIMNSRDEALAPFVEGWRSHNGASSVGVTGISRLEAVLLNPAHLKMALRWVDNE